MDNIKKILFISLILVVILIIFFQIKPKKNKEIKDSNMNTILSLEDTITDNSIWCGTFNLIWNDLKNSLVKQDIIFNPQLDVVTNLNKETFNVNYLSDESYYKVYGNPTIELKKQIERAIKDKFNETSDILDDFNWKEFNKKDYFLYAMLKKEFKFNKKFTELQSYKFKGNDKVTFFGINSSTSDEVRGQVEILYYENDNSFAIKLLTNSVDEVILIKGNNDLSFLDAYENTLNKIKDFNGSKILNNNEIVAVPNIDFKVKKEFDVLENKSFLFSSGEIYKIVKALQTIEFKLDKTGGKIKSEAGASVKKMSGIAGITSRSFILDDTFIIMLKEKNKDLPYFAAKISDIKNVQKYN